MDFPLASVLEHSLYYPAAGFDGRPVQFLGGFIHSFVYVDYGTEERDLDRELEEHGFEGYRLAGRKVLRESDLAPRGWNPRIPPEFESEQGGFDKKRRDHFVRKPFANWLIFDREDGRDEQHGPDRFSLVYLCADGVAAYQALYHENHTAPEVLAIIQPGAGFGGNYTDFRNPDGFFAWTVLHGNGDHVPEYLVCGGNNDGYTEAFWPDAYPDHVEWFQRVHGNGVWRRQE